MITLLAQTTVEAASLTYETMQLCMAAGLGTWVVPITGLVLLRMAKKGARSGSVL